MDRNVTFYKQERKNKKAKEKGLHNNTEEACLSPIS